MTVVMGMEHKHQKNRSKKTLPTELGEVKPVEKPTMDDRPARQDLKSSAPVKQEKYRGKSLCRHEATESLAQG